MNKAIISAAIGALAFIALPSWANTLAMTDITDENNYWNCHAYDSQNMQWEAKSQFERAAASKAFDACKKQSHVPQSCKIATDYCDSIVNGVNTRPMWQCTALDQMAKHWVSQIYVQRDEAALDAKAFCQQHSGMPQSCYLNLMTCKNLNEHTSHSVARNIE